MTILCAFLEAIIWYESIALHPFRNVLVVCTKKKRNVLVVGIQLARRS
jgi:hypothetical protein